jgi:hypothetical protein
MLMQDFGQIYFSKNEHERRFNQSLERYYKFLSTSFFARKDKKFWEFQKKGLNKLDIQLKRVKLFTGALEILVNKITHRLLHPSLTWRKYFQNNPTKTEAIRSL